MWNGNQNSLQNGNQNSLWNGNQNSSLSDLFIVSSGMTDQMFENYTENFTEKLAWSPHSHW